MKKLLAVLLCLGMIGLVSSCDLMGITYGTTPATGTMVGSAWTFLYGTINSSGSVYMYKTASSSADNYLMFTLSPIQAGSTTLKFDLFDLAHSHTVTAYSGSTNYIVTSGAYEILTVTAGEVTGRINITDSANNTKINGTFTLTRI